MNDPNQGQQKNAIQLAASLAALRQRLECHIQKQTGQQGAAPTAVPDTATPLSPASKGKAVSRSLIQRLLSAKAVQDDSTTASPPIEGDAGSAEKSKQPA